VEVAVVGHMQVVEELVDIEALCLENTLEDYNRQKLD
jgi:hypothetical protein